MLKYMAVAVLAFFSTASAEETSRPLPRPTLDVPPGVPQQAVFAGGCFWGMQAVFQHVKGVKEVFAGYSGGQGATARYEAVSWGNTGHAESVRIVYDPQVVSYGRLLQVFFSVMDPTTRNYQGPDEGSQYRSAVFVADDNQRRVAESYIAQLSQLRAFSRPIVTEVSQFRGFYAAESYHQDYLIKHPNDRYIVINDQPKIAALQRLYPDLYQERPVSVALRR